MIEVSNGDRIVIEGPERWNISLDVTVEHEDPPLWRDIRSELATNDDCPGSLRNGWWKRRLNQIAGLTFHHTLSHSPWAFAKYYVRKGNGRPTVPYTIWITETGEILQCVTLTEGCWHDHTGHRNVNLSVGLAGTLHIHHPSSAQLDAAARVAAWAVEDDRMRVARERVRGHMDVGTYRGRTECPGWKSAKSGYWRELLYNRIEEELNNG